MERFFGSMTEGDITYWKQKVSIFTLLVISDY